MPSTEEIALPSKPVDGQSAPPTTRTTPRTPYTARTASRTPREQEELDPKGVGLTSLLPRGCEADLCVSGELIIPRRLPDERTPRKMATYVSDDVELEIKDLGLVIESHRGRKEILKGVNAHVRSGNFLAVMGGSGAGKTTLLDAVALETKRGFRTGEVSLNTIPLDQHIFRNHCAYVAQQDACWPSLTVLETLQFAAGLYQGRGSKNVQAAQVRKLLEQVGLDACKDVKVGDGALIGGISGGQRRRLSLAVELLGRPSLLVLDEPTSGLDSKAAEVVIDVITGIAVQNNLAAICTIHQPSSYVFHMFDKLLVLASGRVCYFGRAGDALKYFESIGYPSHADVNPAEFLVRTTNADFCCEDEICRICDAWSEMEPGLEVTRQFPPHLLPDRPSGDGASVMRQVRLLASRCIRGNLRSPVAFGGRTFLSALLVAFVCVAYLGARTKSQEEVLDRVWAVMWVQQLPAFLCIGAVPAFAHEHVCYRKEVKNGLYHPSCHFLASNMVNIPFWFVLTLASSLPAYAILNLNWSNFLVSWLIITAYVGFSDTIAQFCGTFCGSTAMGTMVFLVQTILNMIFNGTLLTHIDRVVWPLRWMFYVVPSKYCFRSGMRLEFQGLIFEGYDRCVAIIMAKKALATPCWGSTGERIVGNLGGQLIPVLLWDGTVGADLLVVVAEIAALKILHWMLLLWAFHRSKHRAQRGLGNRTSSLRLEDAWAGWIGSPPRTPRTPCRRG